jgi:hypothetical protein
MATLAQATKSCGRKAMRKAEHDDDQLLNILMLRTKHGASGAAKILGTTSVRIRTICNRIMNEDIRISIKGDVETTEQVMSGYWSN